MTICSWLVLGALAGWLASMLAGTQKMGLLANIGVGVLGAVIGGAIFTMLGGTGVTGFNPYSLLVSTVGAFVLLAIVKAVRKEKR